MDTETKLVLSARPGKLTLIREGTRASLVVIRGMLTLGWGMKWIAHGVFMRLTQLLDSAEKQVTRWQQWFIAPRGSMPVGKIINDNRR